MPEMIVIGNGKAPDGCVRVDDRGSPDVFVDVRALPFKNLGRIYADHVFELFMDADIVPALKSCRKALRPRGILELYVADLPWLMRKFLQADAQGEKWAKWARLIFESRGGRMHQTGFSTHRIAACLTAAGFREVRARRVKHEVCSDRLEIYAVAVS